MEKLGSSFNTKCVFFLSVLMLLIVPFHALLVPEQVLLLLEFLGILVLFLVVWSGDYRGSVSKLVWWFLAISLLGVICYVLPMPFLSEYPLPGRELYTEVRSWLVLQGVEYDGGWYLSIIPYTSIVTILVLLVPLAMFSAAIALPENKVCLLIYLLLFVATMEGALGLMQYASANKELYFGLVSRGGATGTYANRDHFSALLVMTLPIAFGMMLYFIGRTQTRHARRDQGRAFNRSLLFAFAALLIFLGAVFSRSRAGVFLIMLAILVSSFVFSRHVGGARSASFTAAFSTIVVGLAASIGLIPVLNRFVAKSPAEDERWRIFEHTIEGIKTFFPFGSGPGTFFDIYPSFQPIEQLGVANNAHNDYLELIFELGALGVFVIFGFLCIYIYGWFKLAGKEDWDQFHFFQVSAGVGVFLFLLHCSVEFLFHEPMNTMVFSLLVAVFLRKRSRFSF